MKKLILTLAATTLVSAAAWGQAAVNFSTRIAGVVDYPIFAPGGGAAGLLPNMMAQLFQVGAGGALTALTPPTTFRTAAGGEAYLTPVSVTIPGQAAAGDVNLVLRAWQGASFEQARASGIWGETSAFTARATLAPDVPGSLTGLGISAAGLTLQVIPEPTTYALAALGLGAVLLFRRRK